MKEVLIYCDKGASPVCTKAALRELQLWLPTHRVRSIQAAELLGASKWQETCDLLVLPGGGDLGYCELLNGHGTEKIRAYVEAGGRYLGLCAGAYFGSSRCEFALHSRMEVKGPRQLGFTKATAEGPVLGDYSYASHRHARVVTVSLNGLALAALCNGGCSWPQAAPEITFATYELESSSDAAVLLKLQGHGKAALSGVHPEMTYQDVKPGCGAGHGLKASDEVDDPEAYRRHELELRHLLLRKDGQRRELWSAVLGQGLGLPCEPPPCGFVVIIENPSTKMGVELSCQRGCLAICSHPAIGAADAGGCGFSLLWNGKVARRIDHSAQQVETMAKSTSTAASSEEANKLRTILECNPWIHPEAHVKQQIADAKLVPINDADALLWPFEPAARVVTIGSGYWVLADNNDVVGCQYKDPCHNDRTVTLWRRNGHNSTEPSSIEVLTGIALNGAIVDGWVVHDPVPFAFQQEHFKA